MKIIIRRANPEDGADLARIFLAARAAMTYLARLHSDEDTICYIEHIVRIRDVLVALDEAATSPRPIGFAAIHDTSEKIWLEHLYVHPAAQGKGAGKALLDCVKTLRPHGFGLWVFQQNLGARRFYARHGLTLARLTDGGDNEEKCPDALYEWSGDVTGEDKTL